MTDLKIPSDEPRTPYRVSPSSTVEILPSNVASGRFVGPLRTHAFPNMTCTSGRQRVPSECFDTFWLAVPTPDIARRFDEITAPLMTKIKANSTESRTLATLRDTLLPKLLSRELSAAQTPI